MNEQVERQPRISLMLMAQLLRQHGDPTLHRVSNLSESGVRLAQVSKLNPGDVVSVLVGCADAVSATVAWVRDGTAGLQFNEAICLEDARQRRPDYAAPDIKAGWMTEIRHAHRR